MTCRRLSGLTERSGELDQVVRLNRDRDRRDGHRHGDGQAHQFDPGAGAVARERVDSRGDVGAGERQCGRSCAPGSERGSSNRTGDDRRIADLACRILVGPPLSRESDPASGGPKRRHHRGGDLGRDDKTVMTVTEMGAFVGEHRATLVDIEQIQHASRDDDMGMAARNCECGWCFGLDHEQVSIRCRAPASLVVERQQSRRTRHTTHHNDERHGPEPCGHVHVAVEGLSTPCGAIK